MRRAGYSVAVVTALLLTHGCGDSQEQAAPNRPSTENTIAPPSLTGTFPLTVKGVADARTVLLSDGTQVRIAGLAAAQECWAAAATVFTKAFLLDKQVKIDPVDPAIVDQTPLWLADGTEFALLAVSQGLLRGDAPHDRAFVEAEAAAAKAELGLWGAPCRGQGTLPTTTPPPPAPAAPAPTPTAAKPVVFGCAASYRVTYRWQGGFNADVTIANTGNAPISGWTLRWRFPSGQVVTKMWNATVAQSGAEVSATNDSNTTTIAAGGSQLIGFTGVHRGMNVQPNAFSLNGRQCEIR